MSTIIMQNEEIIVESFVRFFIENAFFLGYFFN